MEPLSGHLLIAGTSLLDPNFRRAVVLIGHHDDEGAVGVVLNRASEVEVAVAGIKTMARLLITSTIVQLLAPESAARPSARPW